MIQKIKTLILSLSLLFTFAAPMVVTSSAYAATPNITNSTCEGANGLAVNPSNNPGVTACNTDSSSSLNDKIAKVLNIFSVVIGLIAVVMIIVAGFRYITSGGKDDAVKGAKNTILYAVIGLVIVAFAQIIVQFVLKNAA